MVFVTAGIIRKEGKILIAQRRKGDRLGDKWEFLGGKIEENESPEECLKRELREELDIEVNVGNLFMESTHSYSCLDVDILVFFADFVNGSFKLTSHNQVKWVKSSELGTYDFADADKPIVAKLIEQG